MNEIKSLFKNLVVFYLFLFLLAMGVMAHRCHGFDLSEFTFDATPRLTFYSNKSLDVGKGIEGRIGYNLSNRFNLYGFGSYDWSTQTLYGQGAGNFNVLGFGIGTRAKINQYVSLFVQGGYYVPFSDLDSQPQFSEVSYYFWRDKKQYFGCEWYSSNVYTYKVSPNFGGSFGVNLSYPVYRNIYLNGFASYQILNLKETYMNGPGAILGNVNRLEDHEMKNLSGVRVGLGLSYNF